MCFFLANHSIDYTWHNTPAASVVSEAVYWHQKYAEIYTSTVHTSLPRNQDFYLANCESCRTQIKTELLNCFTKLSIIKTLDGIL